MHPLVGMYIAWGETKSLNYMAFRLGRLTQKIFSDTNRAMSTGQTAIQP
jgi:hypothetical protein